MQPARMDVGLVGKHGASSSSLSPLAPSSKCPISEENPMLACNAAHGTKLPNLAVENSGWKLKFVPLQSLMFRLWNWLAALAIIKPLCPVLRSSIMVVTPPVTLPGVSLIVTLSLSPWFINRVSALGVKEAAVCTSGPAGPVGTPSRWMNAKLVVSRQLKLQVAKPAVHSTLLMCREAHQ